MAELYRVDSPITREQRNNLNLTFEDIQRRFNNVRFQISILTGGSDLDQIVQDLENAVNAANNSTSNNNQALADISSALSQLETALTNNTNAVDALNAITNNIDSFDYDPGRTYKSPSFVSYQGQTYIVLRDVTGVVPSDDKVNYRLAARRGVDGTGSVASVNGNSPDLNGNVSITNQDIGSTPLTDFQNLNTRVNDFSQNLVEVEDMLENNFVASDLTDYGKDSYFLPNDSFLNLIRNVSNNGILKIAFLGDSITQGADQISYYDTFASYMEREIRKYTKDVSLEFFNYAIGGTGISNFLDNNFVGGTNFNTSWSIQGQPWNQHVRDFQPDLIVTGFGVNDSGMSSFENYNSYQAYLNLTRSWTKRPDIILIPNILTTTNTALYNQSQERTLAIARSTRQFAINNKIPMIDANRTFLLLRDGRDVYQQTSTAENNFFAYPSGWTGALGSFTLADNVLTPAANTSGAFVSRNRTYYNGVIDVECNFTETGIGNAFWINFRESAEYGRLTLLVVSGPGTSGYIELYSQGSTSGLVNRLNLSIEPGVFHRIQIESIEDRHIFSLNGNVVLDYTTPRNMYDGTISIGSEGVVPTIRNYNVIYRDDLTSTAYYTEQQLLGENGVPGSGNGINHPSALGYYLIYNPGIKKILNKLIPDIEYAKNFNSDGGLLATNIDFNTLYKAKVYQVGDVTTNSNSPGESYGILRITNPLNTDYSLQEFFGVASGNSYTRTYNGSVWTPWRLRN